MTEKKRGRPVKGAPSTTLSLRLPASTLAAYRAIAAAETERVGIPITVTAVLVRALQAGLAERKGVQ